MMQSRGKIASWTRERSLWIWEEVKLEWGQAFQVGVMMTAKQLPPLFFKRKKDETPAGSDFSQAPNFMYQPPSPNSFCFSLHVDLNLQCNCKRLGYFGSHPALKPLLLLGEFFTL